MADQTPSPDTMRESFTFPIMEYAEWGKNKKQANDTSNVYVTASNGYLTKQVEELKTIVKDLQDEIIFIKQLLKINC